MGDKVVVEGKLCGWQSSPLHVGISVNDPTVEGDWAALSGRRVRVTVEVVEPVDRLAGCKCKKCGGPLCVHNHTEYHTYVEYPYAVWCNHCGKPVGPHDTTAAAAIDAYLARLAQPEPSPRCPFCGGEIEETPFYHFDGDRMYAVSQTAKCLQCGAHGAGPTREAALDALAEWLKPCPRCGGKAEYLNNGREGVDLRYWVICRNDECSVHSFQFTTKPAAAQWWNKRSKA